MYSLAGKRAVVTGGAQGIGAGIATAFAAHGADVGVIDLVPEDEALDVLSSVRAHGRRAIYVRADVSVESDVRMAMDRMASDLGGIDLLVNNAGTGSELLLVDMPVEEWDRVIAVNLRGVFLCSRFVLPHMVAQGSGCIINIASQLGQVGASHSTHFSASKAGVIGFTKALAREVARSNVRVNAIAPGPIETHALNKMSEDWKAAKLNDVPLGRFGSVGEVVPTALFLASEDASYYVGQTLCPNGGDVML